MFEAGKPIDPSKRYNWAWTTLVRVAIDKYRTTRRERRMTQHIAYAEQAAQRVQGFLGLDEDGVSQSARLHAIEEALLTIPIEARWLWLACVRDGILQKVVASEAGVSERDLSELKCGTHEAIARLAQALVANHDLPDSRRRRVIGDLLPSSTRAMWGRMREYLEKWHYCLGGCHHNDWGLARVRVERAMRESVTASNMPIADAERASMASEYLEKLAGVLGATTCGGNICYITDGKVVVSGYRLGNPGLIIVAPIKRAPFDWYWRWKKNTEPPSNWILYRGHSDGYIREVESELRAMAEEAWDIVQTYEFSSYHYEAFLP